jgi:hypothetical protein
VRYSGPLNFRFLLDFSSTIWYSLHILQYYIWCGFRTISLAEILNLKFYFIFVLEFWNFMKFLNTDKLTNFIFVCWGTGASKFSNIASIYVKIETRNIHYIKKIVIFDIFHKWPLTPILQKLHHSGTLRQASLKHLGNIF